MACGCGGSGWQANDGVVPAGNIQDDGYFWPPRRLVAPEPEAAAASGSGQWQPNTDDDDTE